MLKIKIIVVDRTRSPFLREGEAFYLKRLRRYAQTEWVEVKPAKITKGRPVAEVLAREGEAISLRLSKADYPVALDRSGDQYSSGQLAAWLENFSLAGGGRAAFIIGGPLGLAQEILDRAERTLALSRFTLTHEMSRLILVEQLYRACTIMRGEKYHK
jgi:23S rRNA (pseudouridine1915-N3)-methyltransferase